jgi:hypothetical protein
MNENDSPSWRRFAWILSGALGVGVVALVVVLVTGGGTEEAQGQTIRFQDAAEAGPDPFTGPADVHGSIRVLSGAQSVSGEPASGVGTFGGSGSDYVCDRKKLIRELLARPDRMRAWAEVLGIEPTPEAVTRYIRSLRPVTLTRDTQVTNHSFTNGQAVAYQAILQAGTAVLVDKYGRPVARCRCGNPLTEPVYYKKATCLGCPPKYDPPPPCKYRRYPGYERQYGPGTKYPPGTFGAPPQPRPPATSARNSYSTCYVFYPDPPQVAKPRLVPAPAEPTYTPPEPEPTTTTTTTPAPAPEPEPPPSGCPADRYVDGVCYPECNDEYGNNEVYPCAYGGHLFYGPAQKRRGRR